METSKVELGCGKVCDGGVVFGENLNILERQAYEEVLAQEKTAEEQAIAEARTRYWNLLHFFDIEWRDVPFGD